MGKGNTSVCVQVVNDVIGLTHLQNSPNMWRRLFSTFPLHKQSNMKAVLVHSAHSLLYHVIYVLRTVLEIVCLICFINILCELLNIRLTTLFYGKVCMQRGVTGSSSYLHRNDPPLRVLCMTYTHIVYGTGPCP